MSSFSRRPAGEARVGSRVGCGYRYSEHRTRHFHICSPLDLSCILEVHPSCSSSSNELNCIRWGVEQTKEHTTHRRCIVYRVFIVLFSCVSTTGWNTYCPGRNTRLSVATSSSVFRALTIESILPSVFLHMYW